MKETLLTQFWNEVPPEYKAQCQAVQGSQLLSAAPVVAQAKNVRCVVDVARDWGPGDNSPVNEPWDLSGHFPR